MRTNWSEKENENTIEDTRTELKLPDIYREGNEQRAVWIDKAADMRVCSSVELREIWGSRVYAIEKLLELVT